MTDDEMRHVLAEALWRIDTGTDSIPLAQASPSSHRTYARAATDLLPTVRAIAAAAYGQGRDDEATGLPMGQESTETRLPVERCWGCGATTLDPGLLRHNPGCASVEDDR